MTQRRRASVIDERESAGDVLDKQIDEAAFLECCCGERRDVGDVETAVFDGSPGNRKG